MGKTENREISFAEVVFFIIHTNIYKHAITLNLILYINSVLSYIFILA